MGILAIDLRSKKPDFRTVVVSPITTKLGRLGVEMMPLKASKDS